MTSTIHFRDHLFRDLETDRSLNDRLQTIHRVLLEDHPDLRRIAVGLIDDDDELVSTYLSSDPDNALVHYQARLESCSIPPVSRRCAPARVSSGS